jgi:hypothetical protein
MAVSDYSTTAGSNTSISGIDISGATGKVKDGDNAIRQMMADIKAGVPYLSGTTYLIESTDAGATAGPDFATYRNSATPAASDLIGRYLFQGEDSAGNTETYAAIAGRISDPTSTSEDAALLMQAALAGTLTTYVYVGANAAGTATANAVGLPLGQLSFPATQSASSDANTLDDYEEGTFTPTVGGTATYSIQLGRYVKIGKRVYVDIRLSITSIGTGTAGSISGLPFTSVNTTDYFAAFAFSYFAALALNVAHVGGAVTANSTTVTLYSSTSVTSSMGVNGILGNGSEVIISGSYEAAS